MKFSGCRHSALPTMKFSVMLGALCSLFLIPTSAWTSPRIHRGRKYCYSGVMASCDVDGDASSSTERTDVRQRHKIQLNKGKHANILSRTVPIDDTWNVTVWEWEKTASVVETFWQVENQGLSLTPSAPRQNLLDPFGLVSWPGAVVAAQELAQHPDLIENKRVLVLGAGVGIEAQAAAILGADLVIATDIHPTTLKLLQYGAEQAGLSDKIDTAILDLFSVESLPECDLIVVADVLYNERLAAQVAKRCLEARKCDPPPVILVSDSQRFVHKFESDLNEKLRDIGQPRVAWENRFLPTFTGSGVLIDSDQTYDVKARVLWIGL